MTMTPHGHEQQMTEPVEGREPGWKHWLGMILCCLPMLAVLALVILGVWGTR